MIMGLFRSDSISERHLISLSNDHFASKNGNIVTISTISDIKD